MDTSHTTEEDRRLATRLSELPAVLARAPHRMMFFAGACAVLVSLLWWSGFLCSGVLGYTFPIAPVPAGWAHAVLTQYGMLALFIFGFLLTVFPRWMNQPALGRRDYVPVFAGMFGGYLLSHAGLLGSRAVLIAGLALMLAGWIAGLVVLGRVLARNGARDRHARSCYVALVFGACGLAAFLAFASGAPWQFAFVSIKLGTFGLLLPMFFTVSHRMVPFFSANAVGPGYHARRPAWSLPVLWLLLVAHLGLELGHYHDWLWLADDPIAVFVACHSIAWQAL
jgi:uncharacterized protein involved in response to NO